MIIHFHFIIIFATLLLPASHCWFAELSRQPFRLLRAFMMIYISPLYFHFAFILLPSFETPASSLFLLRHFSLLRAASHYFLSARFRRSRLSAAFYISWAVLLLSSFSISLHFISWCRYMIDWLFHYSHLLYFCTLAALSFISLLIDISHR